MNVKFQFNPHAIAFQSKPLSNDVREFFRALFNEANQENVDYVVSQLPVETLNGAETIFTEMFDVMHESRIDESITIKVKSVIEAINSLDSFLPEVLIKKNSDKQPDQIILEYFKLKSQALSRYLDKIKGLIVLYTDSGDVRILNEVLSSLNMLPCLSNIRYSDDYVYLISKFIWERFWLYENFEELRIFLLTMLNDLVDQLKKFLVCSIELSSTPNDKRNTEFAVYLFKDIRTNLIGVKFMSKEIPQVLDILDKHDRFIGKKVDAIPENIFENGIIVCSKTFKALEKDEVYHDYENFLLENGM